MKECPNCHELIGDDVQECFNCRYNFAYGRVITYDERIREREKVEKAHESERRQRQEREQRAKSLEQQRQNQIEANPFYEYKVETLYDNESGAINSGELQNVLDKYATDGWKLLFMLSNEIGRNSKMISVNSVGGGVNSTIDQILLVFERCIKAGA